jgi:carbonic anhydrase
MIEPGLKDNDAEPSPERQLRAAVQANVRWSLAQLAELPEVRKVLQDRRFEMAGAVYELESGKVRLLS